jgi:DNA primase
MTVMLQRPTQPIDTEALKDRVDLLDLVGRDTKLRKVASTRGGEFAGPCPFCGGRDRLHVQPEAGTWMCRGCGDGRWQDAIAYVQRRDGSSFAEACRALGSDWLNGPVRRRLEPMPFVDVEPGPEWRERATAYVAESEAALWSDAGKSARAYLHDERGLTDETLRRWRIGLQVTDEREARERWGLDPQEDDGKPVWLPRGIVIPWVAAGELWQIKIRRPTGEPRYPAIKGGHPLLFGADLLTGRATAALTEGEFDAMLLEQEAGDLVDVATLGSCSKPLRGRAMGYLLGAARVLVAYDNDEEGRRGTERMLTVSSRMRLATVPQGKDVTEFWRLGGRLRDWVRFELARSEFEVS